MNRSAGQSLLWTSSTHFFDNFDREEESDAAMGSELVDKERFRQIPVQIRRLLKVRYTETLEANCFNFVLLYHQIEKQVKETSRQEFLLALKQYYKVLDLRNLQTLEFGDVGVIVDPIDSQRIEHAFVYLDESTVLTKNGTGGITAPYQIQNLNEMLAAYWANPTHVHHYRYVRLTPLH